MVLVRIISQREENYGFSDGGVHWKKKGGQEFNMQENELNMFYTKDKILVKAIQFFLNKESNECLKYTYVSHELIFLDPISIEGSLHDECHRLYNEDLILQKQFGKFGRSKNSKKR